MKNVSSLFSLLAVTLVVMFGASSAVAAAPWTLRESNAVADAGYAQAVQVNEAGGEIVIFRDDHARVFLEFKILPGFNGLSRSSCPTFQIDRRTPLHFFEIDRACRVEANRAVYALGEIRNNALTSLVVHRLMNGRTVVFRYATQDGAYHESNFALIQSKQVMRNALGPDTRVSPE